MGAKGSERPLAFAMQKVEGSSPFIRLKTPLRAFLRNFEERAATAGYFLNRRPALRWKSVISLGMSPGFWMTF
jgi:predicted DNA-binding protein (MmcQ/YjbR family)